MAWAAQLHTVVSADRGNAYFVWFVFDRLHDDHVSGCAMRNLFCISTDLCPFTARRLIRSCCYIMSSNLKKSGCCKSIVQHYWQLVIHTMDSSHPPSLCCTMFPFFFFLSWLFGHMIDKQIILGHPACPVLRVSVGQKDRQNERSGFFLCSSFMEAV